MNNPGKRYLAVRDNPLAGLTPRPSAEGLTLKQPCNRFLTLKRGLVDTGETSGLGIRGSGLEENALGQPEIQQSATTFHKLIRSTVHQTIPTICTTA